MKRVFVSRRTVDYNEEAGTNTPVFTVIDNDGNDHFSSDIVILGPSAVRYDREAAPGKRVWIETFDKIVLKDDNRMTVV